MANFVDRFRQRKPPALTNATPQASPLASPSLDAPLPVPDSPVALDKPDALPLPTEGGGGLLDAPIISGGLGLDRADAFPPVSEPPALLIGPDGEWQPGDGELGPPIDDPGSPPNPSDSDGYPGPTLPQTGTGDPMVDAVRRATLGLLNQGPTSGESVANSPAVQAYKLSQQRQREQQQAQLAERAAQSGLSGGLEGLSRGLDFASAESVNRFAGEQAGQQEQDRINALISAIGLGQGGINSDRDTGLRISQMEQDANWRAFLAALQGAA